jgi:bifunctional non-homologous end joining protein LigD
MSIYQQDLFPDLGEAERLFVVHKHLATRLHYDFRLEHVGVFLSWAMPWGQCLDPTQTRSAFLVKDHSMACIESEGVIPPGLTGAGPVLLWDRGIWRTDQNVGQALRSGRLEFQLHGTKLNGKWSLIRKPSRPNGRKEEWLLRKEIDAEARSLSEIDILVAWPRSVLTGRTLAEIADEPPPFIPGKSRSRKPARSQRSFVSSQL